MYKFSEESTYPFLRTCVDRIMSTDREQTDRQTDGQAETNIHVTPQTSFAGVIIKSGGHWCTFLDIIKLKFKVFSQNIHKEHD